MLTDTQTSVLGVLAIALEIPQAEIGADTRLAELDWDSLRSLEALTELESEFEISFDLRAFHRARSVADLIELVELGLPSASHSAGHPGSEPARQYGLHRTTQSVAD